MEAIKEFFRIIDDCNSISLDVVDSEPTYILNGYTKVQLTKILNDLIIEIKYGLGDSSVRLVKQMAEDIEKSREGFFYKTIGEDKCIFQKNIQHDNISGLIGIPLEDALVVDSIEDINLVGVKCEGLVDYYNSFSAIKFEALNALEEIVKFNISPAIAVDKLKMNLSVADVALLFRLLNDCNSIDCKTQAEIYRFISNSFQTKKQPAVSEASAKNKFLTPDTTSLGNVKVLLANLKSALLKLESQ